MTSIPQHLALWHENFEFDGFPSLVVLGASGRVGRLLRAAWPDALPVTWVGRSAGDVRCDPLVDPAAFARAAKDADVLLSVAGPAPGGTLSDPADLAEHARLAATLADIAGARPLLLASSAAIYGRAGEDGAALDEDMALPSELSPYGQAKREMEDAAPAATSLRIGNIAGLDAILGGWRPGFELDTFADGTTPRRSYIGPATLARVLADLCRQAQDLPAKINISEPGTVEMGALLTAADLAYEPRAAGNDAIKEVHLQVERLARALPWLAKNADPARLVSEHLWLKSQQKPT